MRVNNPFTWRSKREIIEAIARLGMAGQIRYTTSRADTHNRSVQHPHCGRCSQCIDRRFAALAAGLDLEDPAEAYAVDLMTGARNRVQDREMVMSYLRNPMAWEVMRPEDLEQLIPAVLTAVDHTGEPPATSQIRIADLLKRHGSGVAEVMRQTMARQSPSTFPTGSLPHLFGDLQRAQALGLPAISTETASQDTTKVMLVLDRQRQVVTIDSVVTISHR